MPRTITQVDNRVFRSTEQTLGPYTVNKRNRGFGLGIDRSSWTDETQELSIRVELSLDGGQSWQFWFAFTCTGGDTTIPHSYWMPDTPPPLGAQVRAHIRSNGVNVRRSLVVIEDDE